MATVRTGKSSCVRYFTLLLLPLLCTCLRAQNSFTEFYGYPDDLAQEVGLLVVTDGDELLVVGMAEEIPEGGPGLTFLRTRKSDGAVLSREYRPSNLRFYDARAHGSHRGDFLVSSRIGENRMHLEYFKKNGTPAWTTEVDLGSPNAHRALLVGVRNAAFQYYAPFVDGEQRNLLRNFTASGAIGWTIDIRSDHPQRPQPKVAVDGRGHPVVLTVVPDGFRLRSYDRLNGTLRWERSFNDIGGLRYPLQAALAVDHLRDRILVLGTKSEGFEQGGPAEMLAFDFNGDNTERYSLGELTYPVINGAYVSPDGELLLGNGCSRRRWLDYTSSTRAENFSLCDQPNRVDRPSLTYLNWQEMYFTGALRSENRFDHDLFVTAAEEADIRWTFSEGREGRQDEEYPVAAGVAPNGSGYYFLASAPREDSNYVPQLTKVNTAGTVVWQRFLPLAGPINSYGRGLRVLRNGNVLVSLAGRGQTGDFIISPVGDMVTGQSGITEFNHHPRSQSFPLELNDGSLLTHEGLRVQGAEDRVVLHRYSPDFANATFFEVNGFPSGALTGLIDLGDESVLLLGRPERELSTVTVIRYDLSTRSVSWRWTTGSFAVGAREIDGAVKTDDGEIILAIRGNEIDEENETATGFLQLVRLADDGTELSSRQFPESSTNVLQPYTLSLAENGDLLLTGRDAEDANLLSIGRFATEDFTLLSERIHDVGGMGSLDLAHSQYLGNDGYLFFGSTFAPERKGQQLFLSVINGKDLSTSTTGQADFAEELMVYPNPVTDELTVSVDFPASRPLHGRLYDARGQLLRHWSREASTKHKQTLYFANLPAGNYLLRLENGETNTTKWLIKQ